MSKKDSFFIHPKYKQDITRELFKHALTPMVVHPNDGKLYGPFLYSAENSYIRILQNNSIELEDKESSVILGYYPNLLEMDNGDVSVVLDLLERADFSAPQLIFYTSQLPQIFHHQFSGVEVFWPQEELQNNKLNIVIALTNEYGNVQIRDLFLINALKADLQKAINTLPLKTMIIYEHCLDEIA
ncbi:hypothetical protein [Legionella sp. WA2022007384]